MHYSLSSHHRPHLLTRTLSLCFLFVALGGPLSLCALNDSQNPYGGMRFSPTLRTAIEFLPETTVSTIPVPVLGIPVSALSDTWGDARSGGRTHEGIDIMAPRGTSVISPTEAVVKRIDYNTANGGTLVYTANPGGEVFYFSHLETVAEGLFVGHVLSVGQVIGTVGNSGNASGGPTHLHFGIYTKTGPINPFIRIGTVFDASSTEKTPTQTSTVPEAVPTVTSPVPSIPTRNLTLRDKGAEVRALQEILIAKNVGPQATLLAEKGATGYFGPLTQKALVEYQVSAGIHPAKGYYGPVTRAHFSRS